MSKNSEARPPAFRSGAPVARAVTRFSSVGCWDNEALKTAIFQELTAPDLTAAEYAALLGALN